ncbi:AAA family ATPase [Cystobacter fuscus]|uniref:AAA family ATPase n=1 Tax=Cystobacter fuscus TaxID=43 RepID=UPI002B2D6E9B|nr:AAA family ATPase [Cystobacter fuscus]
MITHFEVSNFKSIKHLGLDLRKFMVFVGPNGAGKTNLVRALEVFGEVLHRGTVEPIQEHGYDQLIRREKRPARSGLYFSIRAELPPRAVQSALDFFPTLMGDKKGRIAPGPIQIEAGIGVTGADQTDEVRITREELHFISSRDKLGVVWDGSEIDTSVGADPVLWALIYNQLPFYARTPRKSDSPKSIKKTISEAYIPSTSEQAAPQLLRLVNWQRTPSMAMRYLLNVSQVKRLRLDASALRKYLSFEGSKESTIGPTGEGLAYAVARIRGSKPEPSAQFRKVLEELQEVYPRIEDVFARRIPSGHLLLLFKEHGISDELGQGSVSDGVLHALALLVALHQEASGQAGLLVIEEPENAIHPWPLRKLIARVQNSSRQIILTTHSETVVNAVVDPEALFSVENDDKKGTIVTPATERETALKAILEESGQKLGDVWLDGSLGGVPGGQP